MIEATALTRRFGAVVAVREASFRAEPGEVLGVLGPNGAGKTTTLRLVCGYLRPTSGSARVAGIDVAERPLEARRAIGYLPETNPLYPEMRVNEYLEFRAALKGRRKDRIAAAAQAIDRCGLGDVAEQVIGTLSKGFRQRVGIADAIVADPPVLVLDEPTGGLDPLQARDARALVRELAGERTILFSSHQLHEVEQVADRVVIFRGGAIVAAGATAELRSGLAAPTTIEIPARERGRLTELLDGLGRAAAERDLGDGWISVDVAAEGDPRATIFERAAALGVPLRELTRRSPGLEEVFAQVAGGAPANEEGTRA